MELEKYRVWDKNRKEMNYPSKKIKKGHDSFVVMFCSGLKDKNGKDIYVGDFYSKGNIVEFSYGSFNINGDTPLNAICSKIEIIGNIYEKTKWKKRLK